MTLAKIKEGFWKKVGAVIAMALVSAVLYVGTTAKQSFDSFAIALDTVTEKMDGIETVTDEIRVAMYEDRLRILLKQSYKIATDPTDIKPMDIIASSDFCSSNLFKSHIDNTIGSARVKIDKSCQDTASWILDNPS